jgi:hypothetical protein
MQYQILGSTAPMPGPKGSADLLEDRRRRVLALRKTGLSLNEVGRRIHCAPSSVMRWVNAWRRGGSKALLVAMDPHLAGADVRNLELGPPVGRAGGLDGPRQRGKPKSARQEPPPGATVFRHRHRNQGTAMEVAGRREAGLHSRQRAGDQEPPPPVRCSI